jgi:hypothetical protein
VAKPKMARTAAFLARVKPCAIMGQKRLKLAFSGPFFFASFLFGQAKRNEDKGLDLTFIKE